MSTKDLFNRNYLTSKNEKNAFSEVESARNVRANRARQESFLPQLNYSDPQSFAKFGSARLYYDSAISRIINFYPYDGSEAELTEFYNKSLDIEKYIFNSRYPRTNGYINLSADGWGSTTLTDGYGLPSTLEHITFKGGPNSISQTETLKNLAPNKKSSDLQYSNVYDDNLYVNSGLPSDYGKGSRESNLKSNFDDGVTVEFWLKTGSLDKTLTEKQVVFDWWNQEAASSANYGRILVELTSSTDVAGEANRPFIVTVMSGATTTRNFISVGSDLHEGLSDWKHYSISMANSGSAFNTRLYVNGELNDSVLRNYDLKKSFPSYNSTLVSDAYNSEINLQGWWRLQTNGSFPDSSGNGRDGTTTDSPTYDSTNKPNNYIAEASHDFDGVDDEIIIGADTVWNPIIGGGATSPKMTFSAWIRKTSSTAGSQQTIIAFGGNDIELYTDGNQRINFKAKWNGTRLHWRTDFGRYTEGEWTHVTVTYDAASSSNDPKIYVNGVEQTVTLFVGSRTGAFDNIVGNCFIGSQGSLANKIFRGQLADVAVWNSVLTAGEIRAIYSAVVMPNKVGADIATLNPKNAMGRIGALQTAPVGTSAAAGAGKLSGSMDEFRFWKTERNAKEIGQNWFTQIRGGVNTDISNTTLGMYYKFNEGITGDSSIDSVVLDYGGRLCNGTWTGYNSLSRNTGSAIVSASAAGFEYLDPIIYTNHPDVVSLKSELSDLGTYHDSQNNAMFLKNVPSWVLEETQEQGISDLEKLTHIMGAYFDKLYLQIQAIPKFRHATYNSASHDPFPFSQHLPQSLGLYTPEIFIDATVLEQISNRTDKTLFEQDLIKTKNLIYQNIYNNLTNIFKSKGTEKSIRNVLRCFNIDDNLIYFNAYANNQLFELKNNLKQTQKKRKLINLNKSTSTTAVIYQSSDPSNPDSRGFISGSGDLAYEDRYGFTAEVGVKFPKFVKLLDTLNRDTFDTVSLFGMHSASVDDGTDTTLYASDNANFQVHAIRESTYSKNVYFKLSSSLAPFPIPVLTTSVYKNVYDDEDWNLSVGLKPPQYPYAFATSGSDTQDYNVVFRGFNNKLGSINNSFELTASVSQDVAKDFLRATKRIYIGATNENITGSTNTIKSDVLFTETRYWTKFLDTYTLKQHSVDRENYGISGSYRNIDAISPVVDNQNSYNFNSLALNWHFQNVSSSDSSGEFYLTDLSSGSALIRDNFGWAGQIAGYPHTGRAKGFSANDTDATLNTIVNEFKFIEPERVVSSDMVQILSQDDELLGIFEQIPNYVFIVEKSLYATVSEEILDFFAGSIDFNNLIGDPVNRYRMEYKDLNYLRNIFFERVGDVSTVERFIDYYKWFDDALAYIIGQLIPASADFINDVYNTIESHVLERNKYQTRFPTIEFKQPDPETSIRGIVETKLSYEADLFGGLESSPRPTDMHTNFWKKRALPGAKGVADHEITSSSPELDEKRRRIRAIKWSLPQYSGTMPKLSAIDGSRYTLNRLLETQKVGTVDFRDPDNVTVHTTIKGGVNFQNNKNIHYTYTSLHPAGPVSAPDGEPIVPQNVLFAETIKFDDVTTQEALEQQDPKNVGKKRKRHLTVYQGRDYTDGGLGYEANKSSFAFPFNVMSASIRGGIDDYIQQRTSENLTIANLHNDSYGPQMEIPMQGPFTDYAVGGHQSRHVPINVSSSTKTVFYTGLDNYLSRPEAWKLLVGKRDPTDASCGGTSAPGAIGMTAPDYPWPEANEPDEFPYPVTASEKAAYYRDFIAKRPVNIRNIQLRTGSTILGNYQNNYEVVNTVGAIENPRQFIENPPALPPVIFQQRATSSTQARTFLDTRRDQEDHINMSSFYDIGYLSGTVNKTVILSRFDAVAGMLTSGRGYRDIRSNEYSVYSDVDYRSIGVTKPHQVSHGQVPEPADGVSITDTSEPLGTAGIRVFDIHGRDFGLTSHASRHTARFGRDSSIFPTDVERTTGWAVYDLSKNFISYNEVKTYRGAPNIQGWWRLSSSLATGDVPDDSGRGRVGTFLSDARRPTYEDAAELNPGIVGVSGSAKFESGGTADAINIGFGSTWDAIIGNAAGSTRKMTFAAWIYKAGDGTTGLGRILQFGGAGATADQILFRTTSTANDNRLKFLASWAVTDGEYFTVANPISLNNWHHVVVTYDANDASNLPVFYVDGQVVAHDPSYTDYAVADGAYLGIRNSSDAANNCVIGNSPAMDRGWEGQLADVAVWNRILEAEEIQSIYNAAKSETRYGPGTSYDEAPGFHKIHRNNISCPMIVGEKEIAGSGPTLSNIKGARLYESNPSTPTNPTFMITSSWNTNEYPPFTQVPKLLSGLSGSGLTWTGWVKFDDMDTWSSTDEIREQIWGIGLSVSSKYRVKFEKVFAGTALDTAQQIHFTIATEGSTPPGGSPDDGNAQWQWHIPTSEWEKLSGSYNHFALVWGERGVSPPVVEGGALNLPGALSGATLYFNGVSQSWSYFNTTKPFYNSRHGNKTQFRNFSNLHVTGASFMNIGGGLVTLGTDSRPLSASIDEWTFWTSSLNSTHIADLYNGGIPCNVAVSDTLTANPGDLWDWLRFEDAPGSPDSSDFYGRSSFDLDTSNPGTFSGDEHSSRPTKNRLIGYMGNRFTPVSRNTIGLTIAETSDVPAGCTSDFAGFEDIYDYVDSYDNFFVSHQIPRSSTQYAWITASLVSHNGICGFYHPSFNRRTVDDTGRVNHVDAFDFVSASQEGSAIFPSMTQNRRFPTYGTGMRTAYGSSLIISRDYIPQVSRLNLNIVEPILNQLSDYDLNKSFASHTSNPRVSHIPPRPNIYNSEANLKGWWRLQTNGSFPDSSGNGRSGTPDATRPPVYNALQTPNSYIAEASHTFSGVNSVSTIGGIDIGRPELWDSIIGRAASGGSQKMTFSAWIRPHSLGEDNIGRILDFGTNSIAFYIFNTDPSTWLLRFFIRWYDADDSGKVKNALWEARVFAPMNEWAHVAVTYDASSYINIPFMYYNGKAVGLHPGSFMPESADTWVGIDGGQCTIGGNATFDGEIADVAVWDSILRSEEIEAIYSARAASITINTMGYSKQIPLADEDETRLQYVNTDFIDQVGSSTMSTASYRNRPVAVAFNNLMFSRGNQYGYPSWKQMRQQDHKILTYERKKNQMNIITSGSGLSGYDLRPVSFVGRPSYVNMDFTKISQTTTANPNGTVSTRSIVNKQNATLKTSYSNEYVLFNDKGLNDFIGVDFDNQITPFEQLVAMKSMNNVELNWVLYKENVYPSLRNEFASRSVTRLGYDSGFWRDSQAVRVTSSTAIPNSLGVESFYDYTKDGDFIHTLGSTRRFITQSIWPLDAPLDFLTRTEPPRITDTITTSSATAYNPVDPSSAVITAFSFYTGSSLLTSNSAGELQNTYSTYHFETPPTSSYTTALFTFGLPPLDKLQLPLCVRNAGLYARKHMLPSRFSLANPAGLNPSVNMQGLVMAPFEPEGISTPDIPQSIVYTTGALSPEDVFGTFNPVQSGSGEAMWEAGRLAGYLTTSNGITNFVPAPSEPFYDTYDDFRADTKLIAKGYSVVPEFRISEHVEKYSKFGIQGAENFDTFDIPGTNINSSQNNFYKDYSNSDFLENFLDVRQLSDLTAKEFKLTCKAAIKFHPYKGFYPAQRALDLVSQFSKSYADALEASNGNTEQSVTNPALIQYSYTQPVIKPLFAPGILFNSIKSGIAVDYPVVTNANWAMSVPITGSSRHTILNTMRGYATNYLVGTDISRNTKFPGAAGKTEFKFNAYHTGAFWQKRFPFETIIDPSSHMKGIDIVGIEPHPNMHFPEIPLTASLSSNPSDNIYTLMASNYFAEVGKFFLSDNQYTKLESNGLSLSNFKFRKNDVFGARLKIKCSYSGSRTYENEFDHIKRSLRAAVINNNLVDAGNPATAPNTASYIYSGYALNGAKATGRLAGQGFAGDSKTGAGFTGLVRGQLGNNTPHASSVPNQGVTYYDYQSGSYEIPQDPINKIGFRKDFIMYSRTTAFGPPAIGRTYFPASQADTNSKQYTNRWAMSASSFGARDSLNGFNWAYTPPYYDGEAWIDFIFKPTASVDYDLSRILAETQIVRRRFDPGENLTMNDLDVPRTPGFNSLVADLPPSGTVGAWQYSGPAATGGDPAVTPQHEDYQWLNPYAGENINSNAMQLDACLNLFGIENITKQTFDKFGQLVTDENEVVAQKWVIQPKFETPMLNFADTGVRPITSSDDSNSTLTLPTNFGVDAVPRGMWHQFGVMPENLDKGIFLEIGDIPNTWLQNHYEVIGSSSVYNNFTGSDGVNIHKNMKSFAQLMGFTNENSKVRLGELGEKQVIKEAVVAVPYIIEGLAPNEKQPSGQNAQERKRFINIPMYRYKAAAKAAIDSEAGDSLDAAGQSIRRLINKMQDYVLPPQFDFINNSKVDPLVMYIFEFKYELDKDDLSYIWQNLSPRDSHRASFPQQAIAHELINTELLDEENLISNTNLRWMVFKVKQKSQAMYEDIVVGQTGRPVKPKKRSLRLANLGVQAPKYPIKFNWPYDYVSIIETIQLDADVMFKDREPGELDELPPSIEDISVQPRDPDINIGDVNSALNKKQRRNTNVTLEIKKTDIGKNKNKKKQKANRRSKNRSGRGSTASQRNMFGNNRTGQTDMFGNSRSNRRDAAGRTRGKRGRRRRGRGGRGRGGNSGGSSNY